MNTEEKKQELEYAAMALNVIEYIVQEELKSLKKQRKEIVDERKYFIDYFYELKEDEKHDLLKNELQDTKHYESTLNTLARLGRQLQEPYFARFDFQEDSYQMEKYYIGIHTVKDPEDDRIIIYDWRAPIASLYYENEPGRASYKAPIGDISGELSLKRRYVFKHGKLIKFTDISMPSDDEFLYEVLSKHSDERMKIIVQSLQKEQNSIIRDFIEGVSVIQGCAGSGKSSIALHKAAYVLYQFRERLRNQQLSIISPNRVFAEYISSVLPDLGEENIDQILPEDIVNDCLINSAGTKYLGRLDSQEYVLTSGRNEIDSLRKVSAFKCSRSFSELIKSYVKYLEKNIFDPQDLYLDEEMEEFIEKETIKQLFYEEFANEKLFERANLIAQKIASMKNISSLEMQEHIKSNLEYMYKTLSVEFLYFQMYSDNEFMAYCKKDISSYKPDVFLWEDGCAIALMCLLMNKTDFDTNLFYLIADEAQDFSPVFLEILKRKYRGCNMLFVGDKNQLVFENTGNFVNDIRDIIQRRPFRRYDLNTNYRSTREITEFASAITSKEIANSVRNGNKPRTVRVGKDQMENAVSEYIKEMKEQGYSNFAVLCKTLKTANSIKIEHDNNVNVKILPVYLAKGLEFDCVAIWDVSDDEYCAEGDRQILYTACTRAMHELAVFYSGEISRFLKRKE